jgi:indole-3-glycerol phosphate synthase
MYLDEILSRHRSIAESDDRDLDQLVEAAQRVPAARNFRERLSTDSARHLAVIAEIKRRSPSKGDLKMDLVPSELAKIYEDGGASCVSVLTDEDFFGGSREDLIEARQSIRLPVLRKDFTVSLRDVCDARLMGADCVLLIVAALAPTELRSMHRLAEDVGMDVLVEVHDEPELEVALACGARLIGVNQRDLKTFAVDRARAVRMAPLIPADIVKVAESGVIGAGDARELREAGYHAVLVGESLVRSTSPGDSLRSLLVP